MGMHSIWRIYSACGESGQGPGEFLRLPFLKISPDSIFLGAYSKIMLFSRDGKLIEENRLSPIAKALPVGNSYVSFRTVREGVDLEGNSSKPFFLPLYEEGSLVDKHVYTFHKGDYFYLKYNDGTEIWELHQISLGNIP